MVLDTRARLEIQAFHDNYPGGYCEGDPLDPMGRSSFGDGGYISMLHACYLLCIKPYVGPKMRGCWKSGRAEEHGPGAFGFSKLEKWFALTRLPPSGTDSGNTWAHTKTFDTWLFKTYP